MTNITDQPWDFFTFVLLVVFASFKEYEVNGVMVRQAWYVVRRKDPLIKDCIKSGFCSKI